MVVVAQSFHLPKHTLIQRDTEQERDVSHHQH